VHVEHTVSIPRPAAEVFPWLFDEDKVPRWTSDLESYERLDQGPLSVGSRIRQALVVGGQRLSFELELVRLEPPHAAEGRFSLQGFEATNLYSLAEADGATRVTQAIDARAKSFKARVLAPALEPRLQRKLEADLARLRDELG